MNLSKSFFLFYWVGTILIFNSCRLPKDLGMTRAGTHKETKIESFPDSWKGIWKGELHIFRDTGKVQSIPMELQILAMPQSENYSWTLIYGEKEGRDKRNYELRSVDPEKGLFVVDEKNSIEIEAYYFAGKLVSRFQVGESLLFITYEKRGGDLVFEVFAGKNLPVSITGNSEWEGQKIPEVRSFPVSTRQRAVLSQKK